MRPQAKNLTELSPGIVVPKVCSHHAQSIGLEKFNWDRSEQCMRNDMVLHLVERQQCLECHL
jgi:hypothetical protein